VEFSAAKTFKRYQWFVTTLWYISLGSVTLLFIILGARSYAQDVALIEQEMVESAKWAAANLPPEAVIAAHDIGALGYFDSHQLIDLAGLVSPEVIPFIRDETRLAVYLNEKDADYLIAFADLYSELTVDKEAVFVTDGAIATVGDYPRMTIYRWK